MSTPAERFVHFIHWFFNTTPTALIDTATLSAERGYHAGSWRAVALEGARPGETIQVVAGGPRSAATLPGC